MTGSFKEENLAVLEKRFPGLEKKIRETEAPQYSLVSGTGPNGDPTLQAKGLWVHSRVDPRREALRLLPAAGEGPFILSGFGLGYLAQELAAAYPKNAIIVVENDIRILSLAFELRDLSSFLSHEMLAFIVSTDPDDIIAALDAFGGKPVLLANRTLKELNRDWYSLIEQTVLAWNSKDEINTATLRRFGNRWIRNLVKNLDCVRDLPGVSCLESVCEGFPALLLAAGPSLDTILPFLPELAERCVIVAVDTVLRMVLERGVHPDFILVVDPQYWNARHLDRCVAPKSALIAESAVYPSVPRMCFERSFLCESLFPMGRYLEEPMGSKGVLGAGGSVATTAWDFIRLIGARPVFAAGLDLSFPGLKTHFRGALFEERVHSESAKFRPGELYSFRALRDGQPFYAPGAGGNPVLTDKRLSLYASWFERRFRLHRDAAPLSLSSDGLYIDGMQTVSIESCLSMPVLRPEIRNRLEAVYREIDGSFFSGTAKDARNATFSDSLARMKDDLSELVDISRKARMLIDDAIKNRDSLFPENILNDLDSLNDQIAVSRAKEVAGFLFPPLDVLEKKIHVNPEDQLGWHLEYSFELYTSLAESAQFHLNLLSPKA